MFLYVVFCFEQVLVYSINLLGITWTFSIEEKNFGDKLQMYVWVPGTLGLVAGIFT